MNDKYRKLAIDVVNSLNTCRECRGKGWVKLDSEIEKCEVCKGTGFDIDGLAVEIADLFERYQIKFASDTHESFSDDVTYESAEIGECVMCGRKVNGFYVHEGTKMYVCFQHYEDGTFADCLESKFQ
jgi:RecJ-like exonuclease